MANCSFIKATDARNRARNDTLIWTEICEVQEAILAAIDANQYNTIVADGSPFTYTDALISATLTSGGTGYTVTSATASFTHPTGTGALYTPIVSSAGAITGFTQTSKGSGYAPISTTAAVGALYDLIDAQDETNYTGAGGNGSFTSGITYRVGEVISLSEGSTATVDAVNNVAVVQTALQDETDFDGQGRQIVDVGDNKTGSTATGLANDATVYTASITVDGGGAQPISIVGSAAQTYTDLLTELNTDTTGATWELDPATGNLRTRSTGANAGLASSSILIANTDLFDALTGYVAIDAAIGGDNVGLFNGGDGAGATTYVAGTTITMSDGSVINIDAIDVNGDVTQFTIASGSTSSFSSAVVLTQASADSGGLGFTLTPDANNEIQVGSVTQFTIGSTGAVPFALPSTVVQTSTTGIGTGFTLNPEITSNAVYSGGDFLSNNYTSLAFNDADPDTIVRTGGTAFDVDAVALAPGDRIRIANANTPANDGVYTVFSVTATTITLIGSDTLTADAADATATIQRVGGTEAVLTPIVSSAGVITNVVINAPGSGYLLNQPILFTHPSGTGAVATVTALNGTQGIAAITVSNGGSGYSTVNTTVSISHPTGVDFEGTVQVEATEAIMTITASGGNVTAVTLIDGGAGYDNGSGFTFTISDTTLAGNGDAVISYDVVNGSVTSPTVTTPGTGYANASGIAVNPLDIPDPSGAVAGISIQNGGSLYSPVYPYIVISDVSGTGAQINVTGVSAGAITSIQLADGGSGYSDGLTAGTTNASVLIYNSDDIQNSTATITLAKDATSFGVDSTDYYSVLSGQATDAVIADQIQYVLDYFTALGYNIRAQVNPATGNTLQWQIIW